MPIGRLAGKATASMIYFIQAKATRRIKIGYTRDKSSFHKRFQALSGANADDLKVLGTIRGGRKTESAWHENCKAYQVHHEWYDNSPALRSRIRRALKDTKRVIKANSHAMLV